jgi:hypothetical protein
MGLSILEGSDVSVPIVRGDRQGGAGMTDGTAFVILVVSILR